MLIFARDAPISTFIDYAYCDGDDHYGHGHHMNPMNHRPGLELSRRFYWEAVRPVLERSFPSLPHTAALVGPGSETLGFDDEMSTDHSWGPRLQLFLRPEDWEALAGAIGERLRHELPHRFLGYPTNFTEPDADDGGVQLMQATESGPVNHLVERLNIGGFFRFYLNFDVNKAIGPADWLTFPQQKLRTIIAGSVFHDDIGLNAVRARFAWYPPDVWRYLLAAGWARIGQEEHLMGRAGLAGDELGSALIASRLARDTMSLCFLMERQYAPYAKWFGTAFSQLDSAAALTDKLLAVHRARTWQERDRWLGEAYQAVAARHNRLDLTEPMPETTRAFFGRPFRVLALHGFSDALLRTITESNGSAMPRGWEAEPSDPDMARIAQRRPIGAIDQFSDSTDLLEATELRPILRALYR